MRVKFIKSATDSRGYPPPQCWEVAFVGRSNAGKSSLINSLLKYKVAKVSGSPGKTRLINFFDVNGAYRLVDLPGYGFAKVSQREREKWKPMVEDYISLRQVLVGLVLVMDIRRSWSEDEAALVQWVAHVGKKGLVVLNKADKVGTSQQVRSQRTVGASVDWPLFVCSSSKRSGVDAIGKQIWQWVEGGHPKRGCP